MKKSVKIAITNILNEYVFEFNTPEVRKEITNRLYEAAKIPFKDLTTQNDVDNNIIRFQGYNAKTNKMIEVTVQPTNIKYKKL